MSKHLEMTQAGEYEALVHECAVEAFHTWDIFAHSPRLDGEVPIDRALRGMHVVVRAVLAVIAEKATEEWPTKGMVAAHWRVTGFTRSEETAASTHARAQWRAQVLASPLVLSEIARRFGIK